MKTLILAFALLAVTDTVTPGTADASYTNLQHAHSIQRFSRIQVGIAGRRVYVVITLVGGWEDGP
jgi:KaiC/GvpD/RAD55 family RecA-like ATPase